MLVIILFTMKLEEEGFMRSCRTIFIMLDFIISDKIVDKVLKWHTRIIAFKQLPLVILRLSNVFQCRLHAIRDYLLVLNVIFDLLRHEAALHEAPILS